MEVRIEQKPPTNRIVSELGFPQNQQSQDWYEIEATTLFSALFIDAEKEFEEEWDDFLV